MNIKPMRDCIFVLPDKIVDKTDAGIILTDYTKKRPTSGTIIAIGRQVDKQTFPVGSRIIYGEFSGNKQNINFQGTLQEIFMMTAKDILAKLEDD